MRVTRRQVMRLADAARAYEDARAALMDPGDRYRYYAECVHRRELFDAMAKAVGKEPEELRSKDARSLRFEAAGVEFFWAERLEEGGDA